MTSTSNSARAYHILGLMLLMQTLVIGVGMYCFGFFVVHWIAEFSAPRSELMLGYFALTLMAGLMAPVAGGWIDRYSHRWLMIVGALVFALSLVLLTLAGSGWFIVAVFACILPFGLILAGPLISQTLVAQAFVERRGMALGICALGTSLGGFLMPLIVTYALEFYSWRQVLWVLAAISVSLLPLIYWVLSAGKTAQGKESGKSEALSNKSLFRDLNLYKLAFAYFVPATLFIGVLQNIGLHTQDLGMSQTQAGLIVSMAAGLMAGGKLLVGWLADKIAHGWLYFGLLSIVAISMALSATATGFYLLALGVVVLGTSVGGLTPLINMVVVERYGMANFGRVMGVLMGAASLSGVSPFLVGWLRDLTGSYETAFLLLLPLVIPAAIAFARLSPVPSSTTLSQG